MVFIYVYTYVYVGVFMGVKNISIKDRVYELLKRNKHNNESFSDVIEKLLNKREMELKDFYGSLKDSPVLDEIKVKIEESRKEARFRL